MSYFDQVDFISNSDLKALKKKMRMEEDRDLTHIFNFGSLVDNMTTADGNVDYEAQTMLDDTQGHVQFDGEAFDKARLMSEAAKADPALQLFLNDGQLQHEIYRRRFPVAWEGIEIEIPARGKLDFRKKKLRAGADLKTTACTSQSQFVQSIEFFDYDQQGAWYMDLDDLDRFMIIGVGKKRKKHERQHPIFKYAMQRGDEAYLRGKRKYQFLALHYYFLIHQIQL